MSLTYSLRGKHFFKVVDAWENVGIADHGVNVFPSHSASVRSGGRPRRVAGSFSSRKQRSCYGVHFKYESLISAKECLPNGGASEPPKASERRLPSVSLRSKTLRYDGRYRDEWISNLHRAAIRVDVRNLPDLHYFSGRCSDVIHSS